MKIAFDENVPAQMVRVFKNLGQEKRFKRDGFEIVSAADYAPKPADDDYVRKSDVPWLNRFAAAKGKVLITGDVRMTDKPHEMEALRQHGFVVFLFERKWTTWDFHRKSSLLLFHWPGIVIKLRTAKPGEFWCIPNHFKEGLRDVTPGAKQIQKASSRIVGRKVQAGGKGRRRKLDGNGVQPDRPAGRKGRQPKPAAPTDQRQSALELIGGGPRPPLAAVPEKT